MEFGGELIVTVGVVKYPCPPVKVLNDVTANPLIDALTDAFPVIGGLEKVTVGGDLYPSPDCRFVIPTTLVV